MANVNNTLNVRAEADETSEKVGYLYKDCGLVRFWRGRTDGPKLQSGDLVGWAKDDYLIFDEEAEALANEVGNLIVNIETDSLRVRKSPSLDSGVYGLLKAEDELDVIEVVDENWICDGLRRAMMAMYPQNMLQRNSTLTVEKPWRL